MILLAILGLPVTMFAVLLYGASRWQTETVEMRANLEAARRPVGTRTYSPSELVGSPAPVQRYFRLCSRTGNP